MLQNEMKEHEGQQMLENLERMQMEELEVLLARDKSLCTVQHSYSQAYVFPL